MNYTIRLSFAMLGDVVPMSKVAEAMALHRTTGGGAIPWHKSTYLNMKSQYELLLLDAAKKGQLLVCDHLGFNKTINELDDTDLMAQLNPGLQKIYSLYSKKHHLNQWGATRGDDFKIEDIGVEVIKLNDGFGLLERSLGSVQPNPAPTVEGVTPAPVALVEPATPAPSAAPLKLATNKTPTTLKFEAKVLELMGKCWNDRATGAVPNKAELAKQVYSELLRSDIRGQRGLTEGMVRDAAKPWKQPIVLPVYVPDSKFNDKRHPFKGDK